MRRIFALVLCCLFALTVAAQETELRLVVVETTPEPEEATANLLEAQEPRARWQGRQRAEVIASWGTPSKIKHRQGKEVLIYKHLFSCGVAVQSSPERDCQPDPDPRVKWDKTKVTFLFDSKGHVQDVRLSLPNARQREECVKYREYPLAE